MMKYALMKTNRGRSSLVCTCISNYVTSKLLIARTHVFVKRRGHKTIYSEKGIISTTVRARHLHLEYSKVSSNVVS